MQLSPIEWTHFTANPLRYRDPDGNVVHACIHKSTGCLHCYAETLAGRWGRAGKKFTAENMKGLTPFLDESELKRMLTLKAASGRMCFIGDMTDIFGEWVPFELLDKLFAVFALRPDVIWQVLTKRAWWMREYCSRFSGSVSIDDAGILQSHAHPRNDNYRASFLTWPLSNVWLGVSCENQQYADERILLLLQTPAAKRFISYEPALDKIEISNYLMPPTSLPGKHRQLSPGEWIVDVEGAHLMWRGLDWCIAGGESGPGARPFNIQWARSIVQQCKAADVPVFVKQMGGNAQTRNDQVADVWHYADGSDMDTAEGPDHPQYQYQGGLVTLTLKDRKGGSMEEWPDDLRVREFPK